MALLAGVGLPASSSSIGTSSNLAGGNFNLTAAAAPVTPAPSPALSALTGYGATPAPPAVSFPTTATATPNDEGTTSISPQYTTPNYTGSYTIASGDTLTNIAAQYGVTPASLAAANGISNPNLIQTGATLKVPGTGTYTPTSQTDYSDESTTQPYSNTYASTLAPTDSYSVNTSSSLPSTALGSSDGTNDDSSATNMSYAQVVQNLYNANQYSPAYASALAAQNSASDQAAELTSNLATGDSPTLGDTEDYAQGTTARALAQNQLQQLTASQNLNIQTLLRQGDIAGATALVQAYTPVGVSPGSSLVNPVTGQETYDGISGLVNYNAVNSYNTLQTDFPDANVPAYDNTLTPLQNQQNALAAVSSSPQYQAQYLQTFTTASGGTGVFNKLNSSALQQNPDGTLTLVSGVSAALGSANTAALQTQVGNYNNVQTAFNTFTTTLGNVQSFMTSNGINTSGVPITNQIQDKISAGLLDPGALAAYNADIQELRTNASAIVARGASPSVETETEANSLIPDDLSPDQLGTLKSQIQSNGVSVLNSIQAQMTAITGQLTSAQSNSSGSSSSTSDNYTSSFNSIMSSLTGG